LAWDRTGGSHNGRVYLVYMLKQQSESDNMDIYVRYSNDDGATWSAGVRVNDDNTKNSQFLPNFSRSHKREYRAHLVRRPQRSWYRRPG
jgi:hypothetical protein